MRSGGHRRRQVSAWLIGWQSDAIRAIKSAIETRLPDVSLPVVSMELINWPAGVPGKDRAARRRSGPVRATRRGSTDLHGGIRKFKANDEWSINWGAPFPNIIDAPGYLWSSEQVRVEDVFPAGTAHMHGMNLPIRGGTYRVTFNSQTFEYSFEEVGGSLMQWSYHGRWHPARVRLGATDAVPPVAATHSSW